MRPSKLFIISFVLLLFYGPVKSKAQTNDSLLTQLTRKWVNAKSYALKMGELMPEEFYDFRPVPEEMSFREQLLHIAQNMKWLSSSFLFTGDKSPVKY